MAVTAEQFAERLVDAGLLELDELDAFTKGLAPEPSPTDAQGLARVLIQSGLLTKHQAAAVYTGQTKGLVLGNYVILDKLGEGGMGEVYRARHRVMEREVAIKVLPKKLLDSQDAVKRFHREVKAAAKLEHQNIVTAYDADKAAGQHFLVMQYVDGRDLSSIVKGHGPMTIEQALDCCLQTARGLAYAHDQGVIHRDIKPSNLLLDKSGTVKILDMGLARFDEQLDDEESALGALTQSGQIMGTADYMAPEQAEYTHGADHRSDIYSLGCTLYVLLTAKAPFQGATVLQKMMAHQQKPPPKLSDARGDASLQLDAVLARLLAKNPDERYQSMDEVIVAFEGCLSPEADHAAGALAGQSSDSNLTAFLDHLADQEKKGIATKLSTAVGATHEETFNKQPDAEDTGTGITKPPRAAACESAKPTAISSAKGNKLMLPLVVVGSVASIGLLAGLLALLIWQPWSRSPSNPIPPEDGGAIAGENGPGEWLDLIALIDPEQDAVVGEWKVEDGKLQMGRQGASWQRIGVPVVPEGDYRLEVKFTGDAQGDIRTLFLPSGENAVALEMRPRITHLKIAGHDHGSQSHPGRALVDIDDPSKLYTLDVEVRKQPLSTHVRVQLDGEELFAYSGLPAQWETHGWAMPDNRQLGFGGWTPPRVIHEAKLQMLSGQARLLRRPPPGVMLPNWAVAPGTEATTPYEILTSADYEWTEPENLGPTVNSPHADSSPALSADGLTLLFHSNRPGGHGKLDVWMCRRRNSQSPWSRAVNLGPTVNSDAHESVPTLSADGLTLMFASDRGMPDGRLRLWESTRKAPTSPWSAPTVLPFSGSATGAFDSEPELSADGLQLLFHSVGRSGGLGKEEIWEVRRQKPDALWGTPRNLGSPINTDGRDVCGALSFDGRVLLFCSDRPGGVGRLDFWLSTRAAPNAPWSPPKPLGAPLNTAGDDLSPTLSADGRTLIFRSHQPGGLGDSDLWMSHRVRKVSTQPAVRPRLTARLHAALPDSAASHIALSADGKLLAARNRASFKLKLWNMGSREVEHTWDVAPNSMRAMSFIPGQSSLAVGEDNAAVIFNTKTGQRGSPSKLEGGTLDCIAFSGSGRYMALARGMGDASIQLRNLASRDPIKTLARHADSATCVAFNRDGTLLASGGADERVRIFDVALAKEVRALDAGRMVHAVAFSPDGRLVAAGDRGESTPDSRDPGSVKLWDVATGQLLKTFTGFTYIVGDVAFSPDGRLLAGASEHGRGPVQVFDLVLGGEPLVIDQANAWSIEFLPTGHTLVTCGERSGIRLWDIDVPEVEITTATFTAPDESAGITLVGEESDSRYPRKAIAGKQALVAKDSELRRIYFDVDDSIARDLPRDTQDRFIVRAVVLDEKPAPVVLVYDSYLEKPPGYPNGNALGAKLGGNGEWIELEFELKQPRLAARLHGGADIHLHAHSGHHLAVHSLTLERIRAKPPADTFTNSLGMEFVRVPAGKSWLGGGGGKVGDKEVEIPQDFYLGKYEVTQEEWEEVMGSNPSGFSRTGAQKDNIKYIPDAELKRFPVENVSWDDAQQFIAKLNEQTTESGWVYRLPTVTEWEYACRGGPMEDLANSAFHYYFEQPANELLPHQANFKHEKSLGRTCRVGSYPPNRLGLYDMHGNVREWCDDRLTTRDGLPERRDCGGGWGYGADGCTAVRRTNAPPMNHNNYLGFRVARVPVAGAWQPLFNGQDLTGWTGELERWTVKDGKLKTDPKDNVGHYIFADRTFADFTLKAQVWTGGNSGLRLESEETRLNIEIAGEVTGQFSTPDQRARRPAAQAFHRGEWNELELVRRGSSVSLTINGQLVNAHDEKTLPLLGRLTGPVKIGLESYGGSTSFHDIRIRELHP